MRHGRRDANHTEIKQALEACGCSVMDLADLGDDRPDLLVGRLGRSYLLEVKSLKGKERAGQAQARAAWRGGPWHVVRSVQDACKVVGIA